MTTKAELEGDLEKVKSRISNLKIIANNRKLPGKLMDVAMCHGEYSDYGGGQYFFSEKGLSIYLETYHGNHVRVNLGYDTKDVFSADILQNGVGEIHLYIPGDWEKRIEELYNEISEIQNKNELQSLQLKISQLKKDWQLEGSE